MLSDVTSMVISGNAAHSHSPAKRCFLLSEDWSDGEYHE